MSTDRVTQTFDAETLRVGEVVGSVHATVLHVVELMGEARDRVVAVEELIRVARIDWRGDPAALLEALRGVQDLTRLEGAFEEWTDASRQMNAKYELARAADAVGELEQALQEVKNGLH